jgi:hypothetical protein
MFKTFLVFPVKTNGWYVVKKISLSSVLPEQYRPLYTIKARLFPSTAFRIYYTLNFILLMWRIGRAPNSIPIYSYIQQDATLHGLFMCGVRHPQHTQTGSNSSTIAADSSNGVTNTRCCRYSCMRS